MGDGLPQFAPLHIAGREHGAGGAAFERALVAGEVEVGLFLVGVMALGAVGFDEREDVVLVGDLFLGDGGGNEQQRDEVTKKLQTPTSKPQGSSKFKAPSSKLHANG